MAFKGITNKQAKDYLYQSQGVARPTATDMYLDFLGMAAGPFLGMAGIKIPKPGIAKPGNKVADFMKRKLAKPGDPKETATVGKMMSQERGDFLRRLGLLPPIKFEK
jgi:hypothetical protein